MSVISVFSGIFCNTEPVVSSLIEKTNYHLATDDTVVAHASSLSGLKKQKLKEAFTSTSSIFNQFTLEKERLVAYLKLAVADMLESENIIFKG